MVDIVHNIITLGTSIIVLQTLMNTLVAKAVATFCHVCLFNHIKADGADEVVAFVLVGVEEPVAKRGDQRSLPTAAAEAGAAPSNAGAGPGTSTGRPGPPRPPEPAAGATPPDTSVAAEAATEGGDGDEDKDEEAEVTEEAAEEPGLVPAEPEPAWRLPDIVTPSLPWPCALRRGPGRTATLRRPRRSAPEHPEDAPGGGPGEQ